MRKFFICISLFLNLSIANAATQQQCNDRRDKIWASVDAQFQNIHSKLMKKINALIANGYNPADYYDVNLDLKINYYAAIEAAKKARDESFHKLQNELIPKDCNDSQLNEDLANLTKLLLEPVMSVFPNNFRIDSDTIIKDGKILGGENAVIPQVREDILNAIGVGGDAADAVRNPQKIITSPICSLFNC